MSLISAAADALVLLKQEGVEGCLVGGLAVSVYCDPRFTRDVDLAIAVDNDARAELLMQSLVRFKIHLWKRQHNYFQNMIFQLFRHFQKKKDWRCLIYIMPFLRKNN